MKFNRRGFDNMDPFKTGSVSLEKTHEQVFDHEQGEADWDDETYYPEAIGGVADYGEHTALADVIANDNDFASNECDSEDIDDQKFWGGAAKSDEAQIVRDFPANPGDESEVLVEVPEKSDVYYEDLEDLIRIQGELSAEAELEQEDALKKKKAAARKNREKAIAEDRRRQEEIMSAENERRMKEGSAQYIQQDLGSPYPQAQDLSMHSIQKNAGLGDTAFHDHSETGADRSFSRDGEFTDWAPVFVGYETGSEYVVREYTPNSYAAAQDREHERRKAYYEEVHQDKLAQQQAKSDEVVQNLQQAGFAREKKSENYKSFGSEGIDFSGKNQHSALVRDGGVDEKASTISDSAYKSLRLNFEQSRAVFRSYEELVPEHITEQYKAASDRFFSVRRRIDSGDLTVVSTSELLQNTDLGTNPYRPAEEIKQTGGVYERDIDRQTREAAAHSVPPMHMGYIGHNASPTVEQRRISNDALSPRKPYGMATEHYANPVNAEPRAIVGQEYGSSVVAAPHSDRVGGVGSTVKDVVSPPHAQHADFSTVVPGQAGYSSVPLASGKYELPAKERDTSGPKAVPSYGYREAERGPGQSLDDGQRMFGMRQVIPVEFAQHSVTTITQAQYAQMQNRYEASKKEIAGYQGAHVPPEVLKRAAHAERRYQATRAKIECGDLRVAPSGHEAVGVSITAGDAGAKGAQGNPVLCITPARLEHLEQKHLAMQHEVESYKGADIPLAVAKRAEETGRVYRNIQKKVAEGSLLVADPPDASRVGHGKLISEGRSGTPGNNYRFSQQEVISYQEKSHPLTQGIPSRGDLRAVTPGPSVSQVGSLSVHDVQPAGVPTDSASTGGAIGSPASTITRVRLERLEQKHLAMQREVASYNGNDVPPVIAKQAKDTARIYHNIQEKVYTGSLVVVDSVHASSGFPGKSISQSRYEALRHNHISSQREIAAYQGREVPPDVLKRAALASKRFQAAQTRIECGALHIVHKGEVVTNPVRSAETGFRTSSPATGSGSGGASAPQERVSTISQARYENLQRQVSAAKKELAGYQDRGSAPEAVVRRAAKVSALYQSIQRKIENGTLQVVSFTPSDAHPKGASHSGAQKANSRGSGSRSRSFAQGVQSFRYTDKDNFDPSGKRTGNRHIKPRGTPIQRSSINKYDKLKIYHSSKVGAVVGSASREVVGAVGWKVVALARSEQSGTANMMVESKQKAGDALAAARMAVDAPRQLAAAYAAATDVVHGARNAGRFLQGKKALDPLQHKSRTLRQLDREMAIPFSGAERARIDKKFGVNVLFSDAKLQRKIFLQTAANKNLSAKIKSLKAKGAALTADERKHLMDLLQQKKAADEALRKLHGLRKARGAAVERNRRVDRTVERDAKKTIKRSAKKKQKLSKDDKSLIARLKERREFLERRKKLAKAVSTRKRLFSSLGGAFERAARESEESGVQGLLTASRTAQSRLVRSVLKYSMKAALLPAALAKKGLVATYRLARGADSLLNGGRIGARIDSGVATVRAAKKAVTTGIHNAGETAVRSVIRSRVYRELNGGLYNRAASRIRSAVPDRIRTRFTAGADRVRNVRDTVLSKYNALKKRLANSRLGRMMKSVGDGFRAIGVAFGFVKKWLIRAGVCAAAFLLAVVMIGTFLTSIGGVAGSFLMADSGEDGRINLMPFIEVLNGEQADINAIVAGHKSNTEANGGKYKQVYVNYLGGGVGNNYREILSMTAVYFQQDFANEDAVNRYVTELFRASNRVSTSESDLYYCSGCEERSYHCYDALDGYATDVRRTLHAKSDHSGESKIIGSNKGCTKSAYFSCGTCIWHSKGHWMDNPGACTNYTKLIVNPLDPDSGYRYKCNGHCHGQHYSYSCPGHTEKICKGHIDLYVNVTCFTFDEIFYLEAASGVSESTTTLVGSEITEQVWNFLKSKGIDDIHAAAIMGNIEGESNFNPDLIEVGSGAGYGLCQWTGGRRTQLNAYAASVGKPASDLGVQLDFFWMEYAPGASNSYASYQWISETYSYAGFLDCETIEDATTHFCRGWERAGIERLNDRIEAAKKYYNLYEGTSPVVDPGSDETVRAVIDYEALANEAAAGSLSVREALECFGFAKDPEITWKTGRFDSDDAASFAAKLKEYDSTHIDAAFTNVEQNVFAYVTLSLDTLKDLAVEKIGHCDEDTAFAIISSILIPYDREHPSELYQSDRSSEFYFDGWTEENRDWSKDIYENMTSEHYSGLDKIAGGAGIYHGSVSLEDLVIRGSKMDVVYYCQKDSRWASKVIIPGVPTVSASGKPTNMIGPSGCGFTSMAMVVSSMTDTMIDPAGIVDIYGSRYYAPGAGAYHSIVAGISGDYGLSCTELRYDNLQGVLDALQEGNLVVALVGRGGSGWTGNGYYRGDGHFLVICGVTEDGSFLLADPSRPDVSSSGQPIAIDYFVASGIKKFWVVGK